MVRRDVLRAAVLVAVLLVSGAAASVPGGDDGLEKSTGTVCDQPDGSPTTHVVDDDPGQGDFDTVQAGTYDTRNHFGYGESAFTATGYVDETCHLTIRGAGDAPSDVAFEGGADADTACETGTDYALYAHGVENVTFENMAAYDYKEYGFYWHATDGFYGYDLVAGDNCVYGIIGHSSRIGEIADTETYGSGDSGLYVGEIADCECHLHDNLVHTNVIGYSGTRANGVLLSDNTFRNNIAGILPNMLIPENTHHLLEGRQDPYQCCSVYINNRVVDNNNVYAEDENGDGDTSDPGEDGVRPHGFTEGEIRPPSGMGIMLAGSNANVVTRNTIEDHDQWGIVVNWLFVPSSANRVLDNTISGSGDVDLYWDGQGVENCWRGNEHPDGSPATSDPAVLPTCGPATLPPAMAPMPDNLLHLACLATEHNVPVDCSGPAGTLSAVVR